MSLLTTKAHLKKALYIILQNPILGRPSRKLSYLWLAISRWSHTTALHVHHNLPYVRGLDTKLRQSRMEVIARYYDFLGHIYHEYPLKPKISVLVPVYKVEPHYLKECLLSVGQQVYPNWEICIVDDQSGDPRLTSIVNEFSLQYPGKVKFAINPSNMHISHTSNRCLELASGDYVALLDHDDRLLPNALAEAVRYINIHKAPDILYSDERTINANGDKLNVPYYKPDWSSFMHLSMNYTTHLSVYRTSLLREIGGFRPGFEGSQDHDLMLRAVERTQKPVVHIPLVLYQWRAHAGSTAHSINSKPYAAIAGEKAVGEALSRRGRPAEVTYEPHTFHYRVKFKILEDAPLISIIIPSKNSFAFLKRCLASIVEKSTYRNYEIVISDNGTEDKDTLSLYRRYESDLAGRFQVLLRNAPFNFAKQINAGVDAARGRYLLFLNNDTEVITPGWMEELLSLCQHREVGSVGCKLLFPNGTIQHGGILTVGRDIAVHPGLMEPADDNMYNNVLNTLHETTAITGACLMIRREVYEEMGRLDASFLPNGYGDVELGIKLRKHDYVNLYTPYATLIHFESPTRGRSIEYAEKFYLMEKYGTDLLRDSYLNPNLIYGTGYKIDQGYEDLDLTRREMEFFLNTPQAEWVEITARF